MNAEKVVFNLRKIKSEFIPEDRKDLRDALNDAIIAVQQFYKNKKL